jgi:hypothetical protein
MKEEKIYDEDGKGVTTVFYASDFEFVNPIQYYSDTQIKTIMSMERELLTMKNPILASELSQEFFFKRALEQWNERYVEIKATKVPENFLKLLDAKSKKEQVKLLLGQCINPDELIAFIFKAWEEGFSFSQYTTEHHHKGLDTSKLPKLIHLKNKEIKTVGKTDLSDGQLRQVIEQRKVTVAKFFDKGQDWHCLFLTFNSIVGKESWKGGQAHLHYISSKYNITREQAVNGFKNGNYPSTSVHIDLLDYGNQTV